MPNKITQQDNNKLKKQVQQIMDVKDCLLYTSPSPRD